MDTQKHTIDPAKISTALEILSKKLCDVTEVLNRCQLLTTGLAKLVDDIAKSYAILRAEKIAEQLDIENETSGK